MFQLPLSLFSSLPMAGLFEAAVYVPDRKEGELPEVLMLLPHLEEANHFAHMKWVCCVTSDMKT